MSHAEPSQRHTGWIPIGIGEVGERLSAFRLRDARALRGMRRSLERYGQLTPLVVFNEESGLELIDGFKRVHAARVMGWTELGARIADVDGVAAKLWLAELGNQHGLTELEQAWLVRSLYRDDRLTQPEIAVRLGRHKSWVWRRLMLVEALDATVQSHVRLGLLAPRAAAELSRLPRGNQEPAARLVIRDGLTVRQTERLVQTLRECPTPEARLELVARFTAGEHPFPVTPRRSQPSDADRLIRDIAQIRQLAGRVEARLLDGTLDALSAGAADLTYAALAELAPVLARTVFERHGSALAAGGPMKGFSSRQELVHEVVVRAAQGLSKRAIARSLGVSRNTVKVILQSHGRQREEGAAAIAPRPKRAPRATKVDPFRARVSGLLERYPDITAQRVFEIIKEHGFAGGYTAVKKHLRKLRPPPKPAPSLPTPEWEPGEMSECDWSPYEIEFSLSGLQKVVLFGYMLSFSTRKFFDAFEGEGLHPLMDGHVHAFERFQGCARRCTYDGQKAVVLRWEGHQPIYNPRFLAFATYYEFRPRAVRGQPNAKPRVERSFWEHERSFLNGRSFRDFADFRQQLAHWLDTIVDQRRRHGTTALERFETERAKLVPLPRKPYDTARVVYRLCGIDGFVDWQGNRYAVPYDHVTDFLPVRITQRELFVYAPDLSCIARHELAPRGMGKKLDPLDLHSARSRARAAASDLDQVREAFEHMGVHSLEFFRLLSAAPARQWSHVARRILLLRERYATDDLDRALAHAVRFGAVAADAVERILEAHHQPRTLDEYVAEDTARRIDAIVGAARTEPRDLDEYERLPVRSRSLGFQENTACPETPVRDLSLNPPNPPAPLPSQNAAPGSMPTPCADSDWSNTSNSSD